MKNKKKIILLALPILIVVILTTLVLTKTVDLTKILGLVNPMNLKSSDVPYTNNSQSTVQGAIDDLYTKANTLNAQLTTCQTNLANAVPIDPDTFKTNTAKTVYASSKGVCIKRNNKLNCFKINNWAEEQNHIQQVFSDISCSVDSSYVICSASGFYCGVTSNGSVRCLDLSDNSSCDVNGFGSVNCC